MLTTVYLLRDIYSILMESTPRDVRSKDLLRDLRRVDGVHCVSCLHIWQVRKLNPTRANFAKLGSSGVFCLSGPGDDFEVEGP